MALGFGFNKAKVMHAAEKFVQQGKLQNAINEYEKVVAQDPKELGVINTLGDLYARLGQAERAAACFQRVGEQYAHDGFTVKAIAMFKKLTKLHPGQLDAVLKLAELYTQQGLYNDARQQYLIVAEHCRRSNNASGAAAVLQKMLALDPDNPSLHSKLADLYIQMGKVDEARDIYFQAADSLHLRGALEAADEALAKGLKLAPGNTPALLKRAQIACQQGDPNNAISHLQQLPNLQAHADALALLLRARLQAGQSPEAEAVARTLAASHHDLSGIQLIAEAQMNSGSLDKALALYQEFAPQLGLEVLDRALQPALHKARNDVAALEIIRGMYQQIGSQTHVIEATEALADALCSTPASAPSGTPACGTRAPACDLKRARDLYQELARIEPENPHHQQHYRQLVAKLGEDAAVRPLSPQEAVQAFVVDELEISAPAVEQEYPAAVEEAIKAALTDSELLDSYNLPAKALAPLEKVLAQAPRDARLNQRLASLYAGAERYAEAAVCCEVLQQVYRASGHLTEARQYGDMAAKYRGAASGAPVRDLTPAPASDLTRAPDLSPQSAAGEAVPAADFDMAVTPPPAPAPPLVAHEVDISDEWETAFEPDEISVEMPPPPAVTPAADEFAVAIPAEAPAEVVPERAVEEPPEPAPAAPEPAAEVVPAAPAGPAKAAAAVAAGGDVLGAFVSDLEAALPTDFGVAAPAPPSAVTSAMAAAPGITAASVPAIPPAPPPVAEALTAPAAPLSAEASLLQDMFAEFKEDAESGQQAAEDPETHYNLGVAFREMALLDEAIGELQKVCAAIDKGAPFRDVMQVYTLLAQCFVDKGVPEASVKWYEKALKVPCDEEQRLALHYELATAYEAGGNKTAALQHFMEVYGSNIDYRDVADRIKALRT